MTPEQLDTYLKLAAEGAEIASRATPHWYYIGDAFVGVGCDCQCPAENTWSDGDTVYCETKHESHYVVYPVCEEDVPSSEMVDYFDKYANDCRFAADARTRLPQLCEAVAGLAGEVRSEKRRADYAVEACDQARSAMCKVADERDRLAEDNAMLHEKIRAAGI